jgi:hypothetical protein
VRHEFRLRHRPIKVTKSPEMRFMNLTTLDWIQAPATSHLAFLITGLKSVIQSPEKKCLSLAMIQSKDRRDRPRVGSKDHLVLSSP